MCITYRASYEIGNHGVILPETEHLREAQEAVLDLQQDEAITAARIYISDAGMITSAVYSWERR